MNQYIRKISVLFSAWVVRITPRLAKVLSIVVFGLLGIVVIPFRFFYKKAIFPGIVFMYKLYIIFGERLRTFFYAQHKILAIFTHRFALHGVMIVAIIGIVGTNVVAASNAKTTNVFEGSLINDFLGDTQNTVVTADSPLYTTYHYIPASNSLRIDQFTLGSENNDTQTSGIGGSLVKTNIIQDAPETNTIQKYVVQGGDTVSSIAEQFGVSTQTVLWSNNLSSTSTIKPGQTISILPVSGVSHTVASGDTVESIANKYQAKQEDIISFNNLLSSDDIAIGMSVVVPGGKQPAPVVVATPTRNSGSSYIPSNSGYVPPNTNVSGAKLQWPTTATRITCYYSYCYGGRLHTGLDIDGRTGDPIWSAESGYIKTVQYSNTGYGINVLVQHDNGIVTRYAHLSKVYVSQGQRVTRGQTIAAMGNTGYSTGDHLHFEVIVNGRTQNPLNYVQR